MTNKQKLPELVFTKNQYEKLLFLVENAPSPGPKLIEAFKRHKKLTRTETTEEKE